MGWSCGLQNQAGLHETGALHFLALRVELACGELTAEHLRGRGFEVLEADNGETGLALALAEAPDMIFLDLHMPRLDGFGVLAQLAASPLHATPVVVCTSHALTVDQKRALAAAYAIVPKQDLSRDGLSRLMNLVLAPGHDGR